MTQDEREYRRSQRSGDHLINRGRDAIRGGRRGQRTAPEFVLRARPDLAEPLRAALADRTSATTAQIRLDRLGREDPAALAEPLSAAIVGGYTPTGAFGSSSAIQARWRSSCDRGSTRPISTKD